MTTQITVNQFQIRAALMAQGLYWQVDSNIMNQGPDMARMYWQYAPMLSSDSQYFNEQWTSLTAEQLYAAFQTAQTIPAG